MDYNFEVGDIVIYKKDNSFYKIVEVSKDDNCISTNNKYSFTITDDEKVIAFVKAADIELP